MCSNAVSVAAGLSCPSVLSGRSSAGLSMTMSGVCATIVLSTRASQSSGPRGTGFRVSWSGSSPPPALDLILLIVIIVASTLMLCCCGGEYAHRLCLFYHRRTYLFLSNIFSASAVFILYKLTKRCRRRNNPFGGRDFFSQYPPRT